MLAYEYVEAKLNLEKLKYPPSVWKEDLDRYEARQSYHIGKFKLRSAPIADTSPMRGDPS